jgi:alpha-L-arabinofuranosidase
VTQKYVRDIRNILYIWDRYGYPNAMAKFLPKYKTEKGHVKKGNPNLVNVTDGKLMYLKMVKGEEDSVYLRLHNKFVKLVDMMNEKSVTTAQNVTYIETLPMLEFEKKHSTEVVITTSENFHRYAHFMFGDKKAKASVNKSITPVEEKDKGKLAISLCIDEKENTFWLIHRQDKVIIPRNTDVDIDDLNNDLDALLNM